MSDAELIEKVKAALEGATPGPWFHQKRFSNVYALSDGQSGTTIFLCKMEASQLQNGGTEQNAALASLAPDMARYILAMEERMKAAYNLLAGRDGESLTVRRN